MGQRSLRAAGRAVLLSAVSIGVAWAAPPASQPGRESAAALSRPVRVPADVPLGRVEPPRAIAGEVGTWRLEFVLGRAIAPGGVLMLDVSSSRHNKGEFGPLQADDPTKPGYVTARLADGGPLRLAPARKKRACAFRIAVPEEGLPAGARIIVVLGDPSGGGAGARAPTVRMFNKYVALHGPDRAGASRPADGPSDRTVDRTMVGACLMHVSGSGIDHLRAYVPSQCRPGEEVEVLVRPEDRFGNLSGERVGAIDVFLGGQKQAASLEPVEDSTCVRARVRVSAEGVHRFRVVAGASGQSCLTNPTVCRAAPGGYRVYWGVLHGHTELSDGWGTVDHYYRQMRDECALDFGAVSDHDHEEETSDGHWALICAAARKWNEPGRFVSFLGYEWAKWRRNGDGDRNVYTLEDDQPMYRSGDGFYPRPADLFRVLAGRQALVIPHHPAGDGNFCDYKDHDPEHERLIEIHQVRGCYECPASMGNPLVARPDRPGGSLVAGGFVSDALALGWRAGFTAGGDDHLGTAGTDRPFLVQGGKTIYAGLTAVLAEARTREAIWDALWHRRVVATSGPRVLLDVALNGHPVGSALAASAEPALRVGRRIRVRFCGTAPVERIDVIRNNKVVYTTDQAEFQWEDASPLADVLLPPARFCGRPFCFYYVRAVQADGQAAWASPVWIEP